MTEFALLLNALRLAIVLLGATFLFVAWRASKRHRSRSMLVLSGAVTLLILSMLWDPISVDLLGSDRSAASIGQTGIMAVAMMLLVYSLIVPDAPRVGPTEPHDEE